MVVHFHPGTTLYNCGIVHTNPGTVLKYGRLYPTWDHAIELCWFVQVCFRFVVVHTRTETNFSLYPNVALLIVAHSTAVAKNDKVSSTRISDVVDAYEHALLGRFPRVRYVVGKDAKYLWLPVQALPEWLGDFIFTHLHNDPPVQAVFKTRST